MTFEKKFPSVSNLEDHKFTFLHFDDIESFKNASNKDQEIYNNAIFLELKTVFSFI